MSQDLRPASRAAADLRETDLLAHISGSSMAVGETHRQGEMTRRILWFLADCPEPIHLADLPGLRDQAIDSVLPPVEGPDLDERQVAWLAAVANQRAYREVLAADTDETLTAAEACHRAMRREAGTILDSIAQGFELHIEAALVDDEREATGFRP